MQHLSLLKTEQAFGILDYLLTYYAQDRNYFYFTIYSKLISSNYAITMKT